MTMWKIFAYYIMPGMLSLLLIAFCIGIIAYLIKDIKDINRRT